MTDPTRLTIFCFAGREENLRVQLPLVRRLLALYPNARYDVWNLSRNESDNRYVRSLHSPAGRIFVRNDLYSPNDWPAIGCRAKLKRPRWCGCSECKPGEYEKVYATYAAEGQEATGDVLLKIDDDLVFMATERFGDVLAVLTEHPNAVVSGSVVNNVVCAKHDTGLRPLIEKQFRPTSQKAWFDLHTNPDFARVSHNHFLQEWSLLLASSALPPTRSLPGERLSINAIAFTYLTLERLHATIQNPRFRKLGDEGSIVHNFLPRIVPSFVACHLYFGRQRVAMSDEEVDAYRAAYAEVGREYLVGAS